jgi:hypothetical protein
VVDSEVRLAGVVSLEVISQTLHVPPEQARSGPELVEPGEEAVAGSEEAKRA